MNLNGLNPYKSFRELKKNYRTLSLTIINKIIDGLNPLKKFQMVEKHYMTLPITITKKITDEIKFHRRISGRFQKFLGFIKKFNLNY